MVPQSKAEAQRSPVGQNRAGKGAPFECAEHRHPLRFCSLLAAGICSRNPLVLFPPSSLLFNYLCLFLQLWFGSGGKFSSRQTGTRRGQASGGGGGEKPSGKGLGRAHPKVSQGWLWFVRFSFLVWGGCFVAFQSCCLAHKVMNAGSLSGSHLFTLLRRCAPICHGEALKSDRAEGAQCQCK